MLSKLSRPERLRLMRFVCAFAWADLQIRKEERTFVKRLMDQLELDDSERKQVEAWLKLPPRPEEVDPASVPKAHRQLVLDAARGMIKADGEIAPEEKENLELLEQLLK